MTINYGALKNLLKDAITQSFNEVYKVYSDQIYAYAVILDEEALGFAWAVNTESDYERFCLTQTDEKERCAYRWFWGNFPIGVDGKIFPDSAPSIMKVNDKLKHLFEQKENLLEEQEDESLHDEIEKNHLLSVCNVIMQALQELEQIGTFGKGEDRNRFVVYLTCPIDEDEDDIDAEENDSEKIENESSKRANPQEVFERYIHRYDIFNGE